MNNIKVSVVCAAYNHEKYIRDALEGFVRQKTDFEYEVLIHDDASTDDTVKIICEYEKKYPHIIKPIYQVENQYSKGVNISKTYLYPRVRGKYIALCEGDDYWTDEFKLQKQYDLMEENPEIDGCAHAVQKRSAGDNTIVGYIRPSNKTGIIQIENVIEGGGEFVGTNSIMFRTEILHSNHMFSQVLSLDYVTQINISLRGGLLYIDECMSVYRVMAEGSWTSRMQNNPKALDDVSKKIIKMLEVLDQETQFQYHEVINRTILERKCYIASRNGEIKTLFSEPLYNRLKKFPSKEKCFLILRTIKNFGRKLSNGK